MNPKQLLTEREAASFLGLSVAWLRNARCYEPAKAPRFIKIGRAVRYPLEALEQWVEKQEKEQWQNDV